MWFWALIASAIFTALFLVITFAQIEAGVKAKSKWLALTFCSLALMVGLIMLKPKANMEPIQYIPATPPVSENLDNPKVEVSKKSASKPSGSAGGLVAGEKSQGVTGKNQEQPSTQEQPNNSLQNKGNKDGKLDYKDPVLDEILALKRQAEEKSKETVSEDTSAQQFSDTGTLLDAKQQQENTGAGETAAQQNKDLSSESQTDENNKKENEPQKQNQQIVKARVLVSFLNVRDKGSLDGLIIGSLKAGDIVEVVDQPETGEWINIKLPSGQKGWVMKKYLIILP